MSTSSKKPDTWGDILKSEGISPSTPSIPTEESISREMKAKSEIPADWQNILNQPVKTGISDMNPLNISENQRTEHTVAEALLPKDIIKSSSTMKETEVPLELQSTSVLEIDQYSDGDIPVIKSNQVLEAAQSGSFAIEEDDILDERSTGIILNSEEDVSSTNISSPFVPVASPQEKLPAIEDEEQIDVPTGSNSLKALENVLKGFQTSFETIYENSIPPHPLLQFFDLLQYRIAFYWNRENSEVLMKELTELQNALIECLRQQGCSLVDTSSFNETTQLVVQWEDTDRKENDHTVSQVFRQGFLKNGRLLRKAEVAVRRYQETNG